MRKPYSTDLSDAEWNYIQPHLPAPKGHGRPRTHSLREILNAVFYLLKSGCQWRLLPHDFPRWPTVYHYFRRWRIDGTWEKINRSIRERLRARLERDPQPSASPEEWVVNGYPLLHETTHLRASLERRRAQILGGGIALARCLHFAPLPDLAR